MDGNRRISLCGSNIVLVVGKGPVKLLLCLGHLSLKTLGGLPVGVDPIRQLLSRDQIRAVSRIFQRGDAIGGNKVLKFDTDVVNLALRVSKLCAKQSVN